LENKKLIAITDGAQIILRKSQENIDTENIKLKLEKENFNVIKYDNEKENSDLLRIQSKTSIMKEHEKFNENGLKITNNVTMEQWDNGTMVQNVINQYLNLKLVIRQ